MNCDRVIDSAAAYVTGLFQNDSGGHDAEHTFRVRRLAMRLADSEPDCDRTVVELAALLHDADDHKLFHTENNRNARVFLERNGVGADMADRICSVINSVSFSQNRGRSPDTLEGKIVQDADRLDAIGAIGIARTFAYGGEHGRPLSESVQHFREKLLLLRDMMNTGAAKAIAEKRHALMETFWEEFAREMSGTDSPG